MGLILVSMMFIAFDVVKNIGLCRNIKSSFLAFLAIGSNSIFTQGNHFTASEC